MESPLTIVDFGVLGVLLVSGLIAAYRGFLKETLTVSAWLVASLAAVFVWPVTKPFARALVEPQMLADILALIGVFFLLLIPISFVSFRLSELVRRSKAGPLDRSLGFVFGIGRGLLVIGLGYLVFSSLAPPKSHPSWVREARLLPVIKGTADLISSLGGKQKADKEDTAVAEDVQTAEPVHETKTAEIKTTKPVEPKKPPLVANTDNKEGSGDKSKSYDAGERRALDQLVRSTAKPK
ncbi:MAG: CvpA family protein [Alphaproteobacteria bacterium]|nr:CvpA family protein [Alphaproteobacteria bacterium]